MVHQPLGEKASPQLMSKYRAGSSKCSSAIRNLVNTEGRGAQMKMKQLEGSNRIELPGILYFKCRAKVGAFFIREMFSASFSAGPQDSHFGQGKWQGEFLAVQRLLRALPGSQERASPPGAHLRVWAEGTKEPWILSEVTKRVIFPFF